MSTSRLQELTPLQRAALHQVPVERPSVSEELPDVVTGIEARMESVRAEVERKLTTRKGRCEFLLGKRIRFFNPFKRQWQFGTVVSSSRARGRRNGPHLIVQLENEYKVKTNDLKKVSQVNPFMAYWVDETGNAVDSADPGYRKAEGLGGVPLSKGEELPVEDMDEPVQKPVNP